MAAVTSTTIPGALIDLLIDVRMKYNVLVACEGVTHLGGAVHTAGLGVRVQHDTILGAACAMKLPA